ncbi:MAG: nicotinamide riboside transporter PnuC [Bacteroidales bacterium]
MDAIQIFGVVTGLLFVVLEVRQNKWLWPLGFLTSAVYVYIFFQGKFYADMGLQVYYVAISLYGWYWWTRGGRNPDRPDRVLPVSRLSRSLGFRLGLATLALWAGLWWILFAFTDSPVPAGDSFTTALAVVATWMLTRKILEQWHLWVVANAVSAALYLYKGLYPPFSCILSTLACRSTARWNGKKA